ncbi:MAG: energy-coupling factor ABC transporter substrate-binding protein, partial [Butyricicoccus sp.]|nr:energy-coupling factor ABC transporter substrate-binding protein [Butyricicoccus sp.]
MTKSNKKKVIVLLIIAVLLIVVPVIALPGATFGGSDDAGSVMVEEVTGQAYEPWYLSL